jgi:hypothetical protein
MAHEPIPLFNETIIIDEASYRTDGRLWSRIAGKDIEELHEFASLIGLRLADFEPKYNYYQTHSKVIRNRAEVLRAKKVSKIYFGAYIKHHYGVPSM